MLGNTPNQPTKFRTKNWVEKNDDTRETLDSNSQIKFKTSMLKSSFCGYSDAYIHVSGIITVAEPKVAAPNNANKKVIFKNCALYTDYISEINNIQIDNTKDIDIVISMYNLLHMAIIILKHGSLW